MTPTTRLDAPGVTNIRAASFFQAAGYAKRLISNDHDLRMRLVAGRESFDFRLFLESRVLLNGMTEMRDLATKTKYMYDA